MAPNGDAEKTLIVAVHEVHRQWFQEPLISGSDGHLELILRARVTVM